MNMRRIVLGVAVGAVLVFGSAGGALAGEIGGHGQDTQGPAHSRSLCAYSGLEDNDRLEPVEPGVTQNWGQIPQEDRQALSTRGASDVPAIGEGCNASIYPNK